MIRETYYSGGGKMLRIPFSWDMAKHDQITVPHPLNFSEIMLVTERPIDITITDDTETKFTGLLMSGGGLIIGEKSFDLWRPPRGMFDGPSYDDPAIIRGYIIVLYKSKPHINYASTNRAICDNAP